MLSVVFLSVGCFSTSCDAGTEASSGAENTASSGPAGTSAAESEVPAVQTNAGDRAAAASANTAPADVSREPEEKSRPWTMQLEPGVRRAYIDGMLVYFYKNSYYDASVLKPSPDDANLIVRPLFDFVPSGKKGKEKRLKVFIDPGHGGDDPGALPLRSGEPEKRITLDIARRLAFYLRASGFDVMQSRDDDRTTVPLERRAQMAAGWGADIFVSIHVNSSPSPSPSGIETFFLAHSGMPSTSMSNAGRITAEDAEMIKARNPGDANGDENVRLAFAVHRRLVKTSRIPDRGLRSARFSVLRNARMPAVLVECGYMSSRSDVVALGTADYRERCARGIYQGIRDYTGGRLAPGLPPVPVPLECVSLREKNAAAEEKKNNKASGAVESGGTVKADFPVLYKPAWSPRYDHAAAGSDPDMAARRKEAAAAAGIRVQN